MLEARISRNNLVVNIFLHDKLQDTKDWRKHFIDFYEIFDEFFFPNHPRLVFVFYERCNDRRRLAKIREELFSCEENRASIPENFSFCGTRLRPSDRLTNEHANNSAYLLQ